LFRSWKELQVEHFLQAQELVAILSLDQGPLMPMFLWDFSYVPPHPSPQWLGQSLALGHVQEYAHVMKALAPLASTFAS
jgi:hypothetical protein